MLAWITRLVGSRPRPASPAAPQTPPLTGPAPAAPSTPLERYRAQIESFEEDREGLGSKLVRKLFTVAAYVFPFLAAYFIGKEIGDYYSGPFDPGDGWSGGTHIIAWAGEAALAMMVLATATAWRRYIADPSYTPKLIAAMASFVVFSLASCLAQWVITYNHIRPQVASDYAALLFRVGMVPCVDIAALLYLSIMSAKSLKHYLGGDAAESAGHPAPGRGGDRHRRGAAGRSPAPGRGQTIPGGTGRAAKPDHGDRPH